MSELPALLLTGIAAGLIASGVMEAYQNAAAKPFGQDSDEDPSTVKFADLLSRTFAGGPIAKPKRETAGRVVHYVTGTVLGLIYVALAAFYPVTVWGFGTVYGLLVAVALDYVAVPALGLASPPWKTPLKTHGYGLSAHLVFGVALEVVRRLAVALIG